MHPNETTEKIILSFMDYNEALNFAQYDLKSNWELYRMKYEKEINI
ncbi:MAG: hypothetical protein HY738_05560 [Bacteroidia bacterium]|nr:hypothetical protein [Bacteroidia bacterium]